LTCRFSANQISNEFSARTARIKADLRLTPEQEKNWPGFESAMSDMGKRYGDRQVAMQADRAQQKGPADVIEQLRDEAQFLSERSVDRKTLADAAQPLFASLDDQQKRRFAKDRWLQRRRWRAILWHRLLWWRRPGPDHRHSVDSAVAWQTLNLCTRLALPLQMKLETAQKK
jgi:hypothetical protein